MKISIIGSGHIGGTLARAFARHGHEIFLAARDAAALKPLADELNARTGTPVEAAAFGDPVIVATPFGAWPDLAVAIGPLLAGRTVVDATNPYPERDGPMAHAALTRGSGLATAALLPDAHVVKAFNTLFWKDLAEQGGRGFAMAMAGDDPGALATVGSLVRDAGFEPVTAGGIAEARRFDPGQPAYAKTLTPQALSEALAAAHMKEIDP